MAYEQQDYHTQQVTVLIAGRAYVLRVRPSDEAAVYRVAQTIDEHVRLLRQQFPERDVQDHLALTLLSRAFEGQREALLQAETP